MAISRMNMERQLRAGGGIMTLDEPRQRYFLGKLVRKAKRAVKKVVKSPIGKAALLGAGAMYAGGLGPFAGMKGAGFGANFLGGLKTGFMNPLMQGPMATKSGGLGRFLGSYVRSNPGRAALLGLGATAIAAPFFMGGEEEEPVEEVDITQTPDSIANIVNQARNQDSSLRFLPKPKFVDNFYLADGGRAGYDNGGGVMMASNMENDAILQNLYEKFLDMGMSPAEAEKAARQEFDRMSQVTDTPRVEARSGGIMSMLQKAGGAMKNLKNNIMTKLSRMTDDVEIQTTYDDAIDTGPSMDTMITAKSGKGKRVLDGLVKEGIAEFDDGVYYIKDFDEAMMGLEEGGIKASGAKLGTDEFRPIRDFESGLYESVEEKAIRNLNKKAEGGLMDLGGFEKDYREGGFVPLGAEERADDVPARLSKNEFVFTAKAVRNAGGGDIDKGAEVMQNMMDNLESGGNISEESQGMENPAQEMFDQAQMLESRLA